MKISKLEVPNWCYTNWEEEEEEVEGVSRKKGVDCFNYNL